MCDVVGCEHLEVDIEQELPEVLGVEGYGNAAPLSRVRGAVFRGAAVRSEWIFLIPM